MQRAIPRFMVNMVILAALMASLGNCSSVHAADLCPVIVSPSCQSGEPGSVCFGGGTLTTKLRKNAPEQAFSKAGDVVAIGILQSIKTSTDGSAVLRLGNGAQMLVFGGASVVDQRNTPYEAPPDPKAAPFSLKATTWYEGTQVQATPDLLGKLVVKLPKGVTVTVDGRSGTGSNAYVHVVTVDGKVGWLSAALLNGSNKKFLYENPDFTKLPVRDLGPLSDLRLDRPFEQFHLDSDGSDCAGILLRAPKKAIVSLNRMRIWFKGMVYINVKSKDKITITALEDDTIVASSRSALTDDTGRAPASLPECLVHRGALISAPVDDRSRVDGLWSGPVPYDPASGARLPTAVLTGDSSGGSFALPLPFDPGAPVSSGPPAGAGMAVGLWSLSIDQWIGCPGGDFTTWITSTGDPHALVDAWQSGVAVGIAQAGTPNLQWTYESPGPGIYHFTATTAEGKQLSVQFKWLEADYFSVWGSFDNCVAVGYLTYFGANEPAA